MQQDDEAIYAKKYRAMKKKLRLLVYERESFLEELKKSQRKLLKISRDKTFLLDRLVQYEHAATAESTSDSDSTVSSDSEQAATKKRKVSHVVPAQSQSSRVAYDSSLIPPPHKKKPTPSKAVKVAESGPKFGGRPGKMVVESLSREEIERRLEMKRMNQPQYIHLGVTPNSLPDDIFSHDNSNPGPDGGDFVSTAVKVEDDDDANLVIDMAN